MSAFRPGDVAEWSVFDAGPPTASPAFKCQVLVISVSSAGELYVQLHPGEDLEELAAKFARVDCPLDDLKRGPAYFLDCVQPEDCELISRFAL